jgi:hypothetical protein
MQHRITSSAPSVLGVFSNVAIGQCGGECTASRWAA